MSRSMHARAFITDMGGRHNLDVFKTPGKLRGKTPHTTRKRTIVEPRQVRNSVCLCLLHNTDTAQPLANLFAEDIQQRATSAEQSLKEIAQRSAVKSPFHIAQDAENQAPFQSPKAQASLARQLFSKAVNDESASRQLRTRVLRRSLAATFCPCALGIIQHTRHSVQLAG